MTAQYRRTPARVVPPRNERTMTLPGLLFRISVWGIKGIVGVVGFWTIISIAASFFF